MVKSRGRSREKKVEKPVEAIIPPQNPTPRGLNCVVCGKSFEREANNAVKAKVCLPANAPHRKIDKVQSDGSVKKICECCRCVYKKTIGKQRTVEGKMIPLSRISEFLKLSRETYGSDIGLAFMTGINAMLRVTELFNLQVTDIYPSARPLPQVHVMALKKGVRMRFPVDMDPETIRSLKSYCGARTSGPVFDIPVRTLQHKFKQIMRAMDLPELSIHTLRHTGIANRGREVKNLNELNYLRIQARHESIETTKLYLGLDTKERVEMSAKTNWAR